MDQKKKKGARVNTSSLLLLPGEWGVRLLNDHHLLCWPISISPPFFSQLVTDLLGN
jgi:hypothetical protein